MYFFVLFVPIEYNVKKKNQPHTKFSSFTSQHIAVPFFNFLYFSNIFKYNVRKVQKVRLTPRVILVYNFKVVHLTNRWTILYVLALFCLQITIFLALASLYARSDPHTKLQSLCNCNLIKFYQYQSTTKKAIPFCTF